MIEADVSMGTIVGGDGSILPIMAHPPLVTSDLSLEEFMDTILNSGTLKGIKLDFKDIEALEPSLMAIKSRASKVYNRDRFYRYNASSEKCQYFPF